MVDRAENRGGAGAVGQCGERRGWGVGGGLGGELNNFKPPPLAVVVD